MRACSLECSSIVRARMKGVEIRVKAVTLPSALSTFDLEETAD
jgi:hypothetical protein